jgi:hypothetical protein
VTTTSGAVVNLRHDQFTSLGNRAIIENVATAAFSVNGMAGGADGNCAAAQACRSNHDCVTNICMMNVCQ